MVSCCKFYLVVTPLPGTKQTTLCHSTGAFGLSKAVCLSCLVQTMTFPINFSFLFNTTLSVETEIQNENVKVEEEGSEWSDRTI